MCTYIYIYIYIYREREIERERERERERDMYSDELKSTLLSRVLAQARGAWKSSLRGQA